MLWHCVMTVVYMVRILRGQFSNNIVHPIFMGESPAKIFAFQHAVKTEGTDVVEYDNMPNYIYINNDGILEVTLQGDNGMIDKEYLDLT